MAVKCLFMTSRGDEEPIIKREYKMNTKKNNQHEVIITEVIAWAFVAAVIYVVAKLTFQF
jgi:hypothetical protein